MDYGRHSYRLESLALLEGGPPTHNPKKKKKLDRQNTLKNPGEAPRERQLRFPLSSFVLVCVGERISARLSFVWCQSQVQSSSFENQRFSAQFALHDSARRKKSGEGKIYISKKKIFFFLVRYFLFFIFGLRVLKGISYPIEFFATLHVCACGHLLCTFFLFFASPSPSLCGYLLLYFGCFVPK